MNTDSPPEKLEISTNIPNNYLKEANFKIELLKSEISEGSTYEEELVVFDTFFIPYRRLENCETYSSLSRNGIDYINRKIELQEKVEENSE